MVQRFGVYITIKRLINYIYDSVRWFYVLENKP